MRSHDTVLGPLNVVGRESKGHCRRWSTYIQDFTTLSRNIRCKVQTIILMSRGQDLL